MQSINVCFLVAALLLASSELIDARQPQQHVRQRSRKLQKSFKARSAKAGNRIRGQKQEQRRAQGDALAEGEEGIVGGTTAAVGDFPFYVKFAGNTLCGGSLINADTILTAAHCVDQGRPNQVRVGPTEYFGGLLVDTQCVVSHPDFFENESTLLNDVAIIKLKEPIDTTSSLVSTIAFNNDTAYPSTPGTPLTVIGFGLTSGGKTADALQMLTTSFVSIDNCQETYSASVVNPEDHICADVKNAGDCNGDSGGPVFDENRLQVGIVSFGYGGCASSSYQDVYTNVAAFAPWIESYANGEKCKPSVDIAIEDDAAGDDNKDDNKEDNADEEPAGDEDTGVDEAEGDDAVADDEEVSDLDAFLDCFMTVYELVQSALGGGDDNAKGGNVNNDSGKGAVEEPSAIFMRNSSSTVEDGAIETESTEVEPQEEEISNARRIARRFWNGVQGVLGDIASDIEVDGKPLLPEP